MKRDSTCNVSIATEHPLMPEEANLKATYHPGRDGGTFGLPLGGKVIVAEGVCTRKDWVTCQVASPSHRWRYDLSFPGEHVTSEIFTLSGTILKQRSAVLILPYYQPRGKYVELTVKAMWTGQRSWTDQPFVIKTDTPQPCVELEVDRTGTFLVTYHIRKDSLQVTPQGGLFHSRLDRNISVRFPKKTLDASVRYELEILQISEDKIAFCKDHFPMACADLLRVSEFVDFHPSDPYCNFRRYATIKLPLPEGAEVAEGSANEIVVLHKEKGCWEWLNTKYKFTRNSVTFDVKNPNKFCVVQSCHDRQKKMKEAVTVLEQRLGKDQADLALFLSLKDTSWQAVTECYPLRDSALKLCTRKDQGFTIVHKTQPPTDPSTSSSTTTSSAVKSPPSPTSPSSPSPSPSSSSSPPSFLLFSTKKNASSKPVEGVEMFDGLSWTLEISGDLRGSPDNEMVPQAGLRCFQHLKDSYRQVTLEPTSSAAASAAAAINSEEEMALHGTVTLTPIGVDDLSQRERLTFRFHVEVPAEKVKAYLAARAPPEEPVVAAAVPVPAAAAVAAEAGPPGVPQKALPAGPRRKVFTFSQTPMERLTQPPRRFGARDNSWSLVPQSGKAKGPNTLYWSYRRIGFIQPPVPVDKEAKVLSGRSLTTLSKLIDNGVALAIELGLKESTVSGIGFDTMSCTRSLSDMTYKILLYWKRTCKQKHDGAVQDLAAALRQLGKGSLAQIVMERHRQNRELTMDCFLQALVTGVDLSV